MSDKIETRIIYEKPVFIAVTIKGKHWETDVDNVHPFKRIDYLEDGGQSIYYGLEMTERQYQGILDVMNGVLDEF